MTSRTGAAILLAIFLLGGCAIIVAIAQTLSPITTDAVAALATRDWAAVAGAASLYLLAHLLRALRLAIMIHDDHVGIRETFAAHFVAAGASLLIPFKIGELFRVAEVSRLIGSTPRAVLLVWSERVLDLLAITGLMLFAIAFRPDFAQYAGSGILLTATVLIGTLVAFYVMPDNLEGVKLYLIRRYTAAWSLRAVQGVDRIQQLLLSAPDALRRRSTTLVCLTLVVWMLEVGALALLLPRTAHALGATLTATTFFFSQVFPMRMGSLQEIVTRVMPGTEVRTLLLVYPACVFLALVVSSLVVFIGLLPSRLAWAQRFLRPGSIASLPAWARESSPAAAMNTEGGDD